MITIITRRQLVEGEELPNWYGVAYYDYLSDCMIGYPIPLNLLIRLWRWLCFLGFRLFKNPKWVKEALYEARKHAYQKGYDVGHIEGETKGENRIIGIMAAVLPKATLMTIVEARQADKQDSE